MAAATAPPGDLLLLGTAPPGDLLLLGAAPPGDLLLLGAAPLGDLLLLGTAPPKGLLLLRSYSSWGATPPWATPPRACSSWESTPPEGLPQAGVYMMRQKSEPSRASFLPTSPKLLFILPHLPWSPGSSTPPNPNLPWWRSCIRGSLES